MPEPQLVLLLRSTRLQLPWAQHLRPLHSTLTAPLRPRPLTLLLSQRVKPLQSMWEQSRWELYPAALRQARHLQQQQQREQHPQHQ